MKQLIMVQILVNGQRVEYPITDILSAKAQPGAMYLVIDKESGQPPENIVLYRNGDTLEITIDQEPIAQIEDFYAEESAATYNVDGSLSSESDVLISSTDVLTGGDNNHVVVWQAEGTDHAGISPWIWGGGVLGGNVTDTAGNAATEFTNTIVLDTTAPTATFSAATDDVGTVTGALTSGDTTDDTALALSGSCEAGSSVEVFNGIVSLGQATVTGTSWSYSATVADATTYQFNVKETDAAGNTSAATTNFTVIGDTTAPTLTVGSVDISADTGTSDTDFQTNTASQTITGTLDGTLAAGDILYGSVDNGANWIDITTKVSGTAISWDGATLSGSSNLLFKVTDAAGNDSATSGSTSYVLDTTAPTANFSAATDDVGTVTGALTSGDTTDDTALVLSGSCETGSSVEVFNGSTSLGQATVSGTSWSYSATVADATTYQFNVKETDAADNTSAATTNFTVIGDTTAPTVSNVIIPDAAMNVGDVVTVAITASEAGLSLDSGTVNGVAVTGFTDNGGGSYSATYTVVDGQTDRAAGADIPVSFVLSDAAGNNSNTYATAISQTSDAIDANSPTLTSSSPADEDTAVALDANITLTFDENISLGSGNITVTDGSDSHVIDVASHGGQLSIVNNLLTINPTTDLANSSATYHVEVVAGAIVDSAGNSYDGIADSTTLNFDTEAGIASNIVVFDFVSGVSSSHSGRAFDSNTTYTIYIRVDSDSHVLVTTPVAGLTGGGDWGRWTGAKNLDVFDQIIMVGDGTGIYGGLPGKSITKTSATAYHWKGLTSGPYGTPVVKIGRSCNITRAGDQSTFGGGNSVYWAFTGLTGTAGHTGSNVWNSLEDHVEYAKTPPSVLYANASGVGILTSQGLT